jgi:uncharacterized protein (TIGR00255 family)
MTGIGFSDVKTDDYEVSIKIKSLNNRGIDISVKTSKELLFFIENDIRNSIKENFDRGSFQVFLNIKFKKIEEIINTEILKTSVNEVKKMLKIINLNPSEDKIYDISMNFYSNFEEEKDLDEKLKDLILDALQKAIEELKKERKIEGEKLVKDIKERLEKIQSLISKIEKEKDSILENAKNKITEKIKELLGENYSERAFIEASLLAEKMDITEEIVRLKSHIERFKQLLNTDEPVGRKMDFLCQEMHREINTLGNKMPDLSKYTVEIKTEIEKIRQQVQNIE